MKVKREYHIDLSQPPRKRWEKMIRAEKENALYLVEKCVSETRERLKNSLLGRLFAPFFSAARAGVGFIHKLADGNPEYREEMEIWAHGLRVSIAELIFANLQYELSQGLGCTAVAFNLPDGSGVAHVRNLDWPLSGIGPKTCLIHYEGPAGPFTSVGWPGFVGVLSAIAPGRFSATINQAPQYRTSIVGWPVSFALRDTFEKQENAAAAVEDLCATDLAASALFLVAGTKAGDATVVEHSGSVARCRGMRNGVVSVANSYEISDFLSINERWEKECVVDSNDRRRSATHKALMEARHVRTPRQAISLLDKWPTKWELTAQQMAFIPASGRYAVRYRNTDKAVLKDLKDVY